MHLGKYSGGKTLHGLLLTVWCVLVAPAALADDAKSMGNTDGVLTWTLGTLGPGESGGQTVVFAYAEPIKDRSLQRDALIRTLRGARAALGRTQELVTTDEGNVTWLRNGVTELGLDERGAFFWEGKRQALKCQRGGQLSRFSYYIHYDNGGPRLAGVPIVGGDGLENLRVVKPARAPEAPSASVDRVLETEDGVLELRIRPLLGEGPVAAVEFVVTNVGDAPVRDVRLSAYANLESAHDEQNDYSVLDPAMGAVLVIDPLTGMCVAMAGFERPAAGFSGRWASQTQLRDGAGIPIERWKPFEGIPEDALDQLTLALTPHPPAPYIEPDEPETRTLTEPEAAALLEEDWLFQAVDYGLGVRAVQEIAWARELAKRLAASGVDASSELGELRRLEKKLESSIETLSEAQARELYLAVRRVKRDIVFRNPVLDFSSVLFIDNPYGQGAEWPHQARHRDGMMAVPGGRLLLLERLHPGGAVKKIAHPSPGSFWRPDLSFDGKKVVFCFKPNDEKAFHLYEVNTDGTGLKQLTFGNYDDLDPIYLPDGHIMFSTTRANTYIRCMPYTYCYVLARCDADGKNIYLISRNNECDWLPTLLNDGRVIYSRWEYTDKALWRIQSLWTVNQDGTNTAAFWGNQSVWPDHLAEARPIPGSTRVMFTGLAHHNWFDGSIGMLDVAKGFNFPNGLTKVTADVEWPECGTPPVDLPESAQYHRAGAYDAYKTPYPLNDEDFLVSARRGGKFRLYLMDVYGNRELVYEGAHHVWHAVPVRQRERPPVHTDRVAWPGTGAERGPTKPGVFYSPDVYSGVPDLPRGMAKHVRVIQMDHRTYSTWTRDARFSGPSTSALQEDGVKRILGTAPIEEDGSVHFIVPAGKALHLQILDEHYRALQTMRSFTGVMPGETRGCVGCHEMHSATPPGQPGLALQRPPTELIPPPWGTESIGYERMVQPVLDQYCGECHQGEGKAREKLDLTLRDGHLWFFKEPYLTLVGSLAWPVEDQPQESIAGALLCENYQFSNPDSYVTFRPMQHLSYRSKLIDIAMSGDHHGVKVDPVSLRQLIGWVDANCPFRGDPEVRAIPDPDFPGIERLAIRPRCKTAPIIARP